jgi:hypothetical protein
MRDDFLAGALEQAERSEPAVRAAALMRIARVQAASDAGRGRSTFQRGLDETLRLSGRDGEFFLEQAKLLAAAVAPSLLREIPSVAHGPRRFASERLGAIMLEHEHGEAAYEYVMGYDEPSTFPFGAASSLMRWFGDEERQLALVRRAVEAWRAAPEERFGHRFIFLFQSAWKILPAEEAREVAREIVHVTLSQPDWPITATYDQEQRVRISSGWEHVLFTVLHALRRLDVGLTESLIAEYAQLRAAALRFPNGMESVMVEAERRRKASEVPSRCGYGMAGDPGDFPYVRTLLQGSQDGNFSPAIEHALDQYREDISPDSANRAPREFWPSTCRFRSILHQAGKRLGPDAAVYLDRIPDLDLRLFAQIEFAAALAGLPELQGTQRGGRPRPNARPRRY